MPGRFMIASQLQCSHTHTCRDWVPHSPSQSPLRQRYERNLHAQRRQRRLRNCTSNSLGYKQQICDGNGGIASLASPHVPRRHRSDARRSCTTVSVSVSAGDRDLEQSVSDSSDSSKNASSVELVSVEAGEYLVKGTMDLEATAQQVYDLLADFNRVGDVFSNIIQSSTTVGSDSCTTLDQVCRWEFLVFSGKFDMKVTVAEEPSRHSLTFDLVQSPFMRTFQGQWRVEQQQDGGCRVHHLMAVTPTLAPPGPLSYYTKRVFEGQVSRIMSDLATAMESPA